MEIILASASPRRRELLEQIGLSFQIRVSQKEERYTSVEPQAVVEELALMKAENVASELDREGKAIIGADTIVVLDGQILGKPKDGKEAFDMLNALQGRTHEVYTGVAILICEKEKKKTVIHSECTKVQVSAMNEEEIQGYVATGECMDKAGSYGIQGLFAAYIERIHGDYYNVVGLPVSYIYHVLKSEHVI